MKVLGVSTIVLGCVALLGSYLPIWQIGSSLFVSVEHLGKLAQLLYWLPLAVLAIGVLMYAERLDAWRPWPVAIGIVGALLTVLTTFAAAAHSELFMNMGTMFGRTGSPRTADGSLALGGYLLFVAYVGLCFLPIGNRNVNARSSPQPAAPAATPPPRSDPPPPRPAPPPFNGTETYCVVLLGKTVDGHDPGSVAANLGVLFKQPPERMAGLLQGTTRVIRRNLDRATAERYCSSIQRTGAACRIDSEHIELDPEAFEAAATAHSPAQAATSAALTATPRPWVRFWARCLDASWIGVLTVTAMFPLVGGWSQLPSIAVSTVASLLLFLIIEPLLLAQFGATPGMWLLRTAVRAPDGSLPTWRVAMRRTFHLFLRGMALNIPLLGFVANLVGYVSLKRHGVTSWDRITGLVVSHQRIGGLRILCYLVLILALQVGVFMIPVAYLGSDEYIARFFPATAPASPQTPPSHSAEPNAQTPVVSVAPASAVKEPTHAESSPPPSNINDSLEPSPTPQRSALGSVASELAKIKLSGLRYVGEDQDFGSFGSPAIYLQVTNGSKIPIDSISVNVALTLAGSTEPAAQGHGLIFFRDGLAPQKSAQAKISMKTNSFFGEGGWDKLSVKKAKNPQLAIGIESVTDYDKKEYRAR